MRKFFIGAMAALAALLSSCTGSGRFLPTVTGATFDLIVVGSDSAWNTVAGRTLDSVFGGPMPGLPEREPFFKVIHVKTAFFDNNFKPARNIVFYEVNPNRYTKGSVHYVSNLFAQPQAVIKITAPTPEMLAETVRKNAGVMLRYLSNAEEGRALNYFSSCQNYKYSKVIQERFGVDILIPQDLNKMRDTANVIWMSNGNIDVNQNMVIFTSPYTGPDCFSTEHLVRVQDSITSRFIPGPSPNSFMVSQDPKLVPFTREVLANKNSDYCVEVRGMWHCPIDVMGGPFVTRNYLSDDNRSIITALVFLYAPGKDKRNRLRMLEAAAGSLKVREEYAAEVVCRPEKDSK